MRETINDYPSYIKFYGEKEENLPDPTHFVFIPLPWLSIRFFLQQIVFLHGFYHGCLIIDSSTSQQWSSDWEKHSFRFVIVFRTF